MSIPSSPPATPKPSVPSLPPGTPFVVFGDDWGRFVSTIQHLFRQVLPRHPVIWVNSYGHRLPRLTAYDLRRAAEKLGAMLARPAVRAGAARRAPDAPVAILQPRALPWHQVPLVHALNTRSIVRDLRRTLTDLFPGQRPVLVSSTPVAEGVVGSLDELASVYFCLDDYAELPQVSAELVDEHERAMLRKVDAMVATARILLEKKPPASGRAVHLPQGVNYEHFATPRPLPAELAALPRPIIGFAGTLHSCCDLELIRALSARLPEASLVFVGMHLIDPAPVRLPNVHLLGARPYAELPAYVQGFDVGLIPYVINDWTRAVDSLKLLEYLAAGVPVVTTAIPEARKYADEVRVAETSDAFLAAVAAALAEPSARRGTRQALAAHHTWAQRADSLLELVADIVARKAGAGSHGRSTK